jgi:hypothetical protein
VGRMRGCHAEHQTRSRKDAIVRAQYRGPQPPNSSYTVPFLLNNPHDSSASLQSHF